MSDNDSTSTRQDHIRTEYADMAEGYDAGSSAGGWAAPALLVRTLEKMNLIKPNANVVDFAAGTGDLSKSFRNAGNGKTLHILATDLSPEMLEQAQTKGVADELHIQDITKTWDVADGSFDIAAATGVWEYLTDSELEPVIENAARALKTGGVLAFSFLPAAEGNGTQQAHDSNRIHEICEKNGIELKHQNPFDAYKARDGSTVRHVLAVGFKK